MAPALVGHTHAHMSCLGQWGLTFLLLAWAATQTLDEMEWERGLWGAAMSGDAARCERLLAQGKAHVDERDSAGYTALHYASRAGKLAVCHILVDRYKADANAKTQQGRATPLHRAAYMGHDEICAYLVEKGARVSERDDDDMTPLHKAAQQGRESTVRILLQLGADRDARDKRDKRPLDYATKHELVISSSVI